jgi:hypothetical protein
MPSDLDPAEAREWLDSLDAVHSGGQGDALIIRVPA